MSLGLKRSRANRNVVRFDLGRARVGLSLGLIGSGHDSNGSACLRDRLGLVRHDPSIGAE